jgi:hypothetical protein
MNSEAIATLTGVALGVVSTLAAARITRKGSEAQADATYIPACLVRAHERARTGHEGVHTQTLEAYGHGLYAVQYEELASGIAELGKLCACKDAP